MFFDKFKELCDQKGVSCKKAAEEIGLSNSTTTKWKNTGATPRGDTLQKIAAYFGVSITSLLQENDADVNEEQELLEYYRNREDMRMLFKLAKGATAEDIKTAATIIEALIKKDE